MTPCPPIWWTGWSRPKRADPGSARCKTPSFGAGCTGAEQRNRCGTVNWLPATPRPATCRWPFDSGLLSSVGAPLCSMEVRAHPARATVSSPRASRQTPVLVEQADPEQQGVVRIDAAGHAAFQQRRQRVVAVVGNNRKRDIRCRADVEAYSVVGQAGDHDVVLDGSHPMLDPGRPRASPLRSAPSRVPRARRHAEQQSVRLPGQGRTPRRSVRAAPLIRRWPIRMRRHPDPSSSRRPRPVRPPAPVTRCDLRLSASPRPRRSPPRRRGPPR